MHIFYDTETTGLEKHFEQILQFAAVQTDDDLVVTDQINLRCRRLPHIVPAPGALITTLLPCEHLENGNVSHYEMMRALQAWLGARCPALLIGHNNLEYDELMIRQAFYQTLHPVYATNTNGNCRADTIVIARTAALYDPGSITVPTGANGKPTFRLGDLARANNINFAEESAHEALADVGATLNLARFLRGASPIVWERMIANADRTNVLEFLGENDFFCATFFYFGSPYTYVAAACGRKGSDVALFDLAYDPAPFLDQSVEGLVEAMNGRAKVIRSLKINAQPALMPFDLVPDSVRGGVLDRLTYEQRARLIAANPDFQQRVGSALASRFEDGEVSPFVETRIYDGFPTNADQALMARFHEIPWEERFAFCDNFDDPRLAEIGKRLVFLERPDTVPDTHRIDFDAWLRSRLMTDEPVPWMTIPKALVALSDIGRPDRADYIATLHAYFSALAERHAAP